MDSSVPLSPSLLQLIRNQPALPSPNGTTPNFNDPPNNNALAIAVIAVCIALTTIFFLIRGYTRIVYVKQFRLEDYIGLAAFPFIIAGASEFAAMARDSGLFINQWNLRVKDLEGFLYSYVLITNFYCVALMLTKVAILLEWTYLFVPRSARNTFFWICYGMIGAVCGLYFATIITINYTCTPRERIWRRYLPGTCIDINAFNLSITVIHLVFDLLLLFLPHRTIWRLSLTAKQKIGISTVFSVGIMTCVCAAGRVVSAVNMRYSLDLTYDYSRYLVWGLAEATTAAFIFCVPAIPIAFRYPILVPRFGELLRLKMGSLFSPNLSPTCSQRFSRSKPACRGTPAGQCPWIGEHSHADLMELEPARTRNTRLECITQDISSMRYGGGILRTTEIDITTTENLDIVMNDNHQLETHYPWLDCESD
ncbi:hypothetical protein F5Y13DRAFT_190784 [Hypoxylon sp. FL1857]|nr:hypothetical protein F5Y13DRAFT_190784 [Hypoxylon sp. FL1857]